MLLKSDVVVLCEEPGLDITDDVVAELIRTGSPTPTATPTKPL